MTGPPSAFSYRVGIATARDANEGHAFLLAFGLGLKLERVKRGMTQDEFADLIGVHRTSAGQLERGQRGIKPPRATPHRPDPRHEARRPDTATGHHEVTPPIPPRTREAIAAALPATDRTAFDFACEAAEDQERLDAVIGHWWTVAVLSTDPNAHQRMLDTVAALRAGIPVPLVPWTEARTRLDL